MMINNSKSLKNSAVKFLFSCIIISLCSFTEHNYHESNFKVNNPNKNPAQALTIQYSNSTFKAGSVGFSEAKVSISGGTFSCSRTSNGYGDVSMNRRTGKIDHKNSDSGEYIITYTINNQSVSQKIIVLSN